MTATGRGRVRVWESRGHQEASRARGTFRHHSIPKACWPQGEETSAPSPKGEWKVGDGLQGAGAAGEHAVGTLTSAHTHAGPTKAHIWATPVTETGDLPFQ